MAASGGRLGDYEARAHLLTGTSVDVFAASSAGTLARPVAIARLAEPNATSADELLAFVRSAAGTVIPRVPAVLSTFDAQGRLHVVTPLAPGVDLSAWFAAPNRPRLAVDVVVAIIIGVAEATHALHEAGDGAAQHVRPWFVRVTDAGDAEFLTFGLPPQLREGLASTSTGTSLRWISPEAARGEATDRRADVYSLGLLAHALLSGVAPLDDEPDLLAAIGRSEHAPPGGLRSDVPEALAATLTRALSAEPSERYVTTGELIDALRDACAPARATEVAAAFAPLAEHARVTMQTDNLTSLSDTKSWSAPLPQADEAPGLDWDDDEETQVWRDETSANADPRLDDPAWAREGLDAFETQPPIRPPRPDSARARALAAAFETQARRAEGRERPVALIGLIAALSIGLVLALAFRAGGDATETGALQVALSPTDVTYEVFVDGARVADGRPPFVLGGIAAGERRLRVLAEGFDGREETLRVQPGAVTAVQWQLHPAEPTEAEELADPLTEPARFSMNAARTAVSRAQTASRNAASGAVGTLEARQAEAAAEARAEAEAARASEAREAAARAAASRPPLERSRPRRPHARAPCRHPRRLRPPRQNPTPRPLPPPRRPIPRDRPHRPTRHAPRRCRDLMRHRRTRLPLQRRRRQDS